MTATFRYGNPAFDCDGAQIHAHCRQLATVVGVSGAIHPDNLDRLSAYASRFILGDKPFVLDLSGVRSLRGDSGSVNGEAGADWERRAESATAPNPLAQRSSISRCGAAMVARLAMALPVIA